MPVIPLQIRPWLVCLCALVCGSAWAETCKYIDAEGRIIYSNIPIKRARKVACFQPPPSPEAPDKPAAGEAKSTRPKGAANDERPKVDPATQRQRDTSRRQILQDELAREEEALAAAKKALAEQVQPSAGSPRDPASDERAKSYLEAVALHERNIASLRQELANLK